jgi:hypothetical protein
MDGAGVFVENAGDVALYFVMREFRVRSRDT